MIVSFNHKGLERFFSTGSTAGIQAKHVNKLRLQLTALNEAQSVEQMNFPGWRLHSLKGNMAGYWSITVNANWRITFIFENGNAHIVDYQDYH